jgi:hypothetical protein
MKHTIYTDKVAKVVHAHICCFMKLTSIDLYEIMCFECSFKSWQGITVIKVKI